MDYPRCATCRWWRRMSRDAQPEDEELEGIGWCDQFKIGLNDHRRELKFGAPFVYPVQQLTDVSTYEEHGCVLHETKE